MTDHTEEELNQDNELHDINHLEDLYRNWFLEYASYVILDRAVPNVDDGLKPVQRRILHAMWELEDGRYNKAANIIGHTMRYHPHGDAAIADAMVKMSQKELLIDTQGNWGNVATGDRSAAPRYIEARLSEFAKEVVFNPKVTEWLPSYDGRNKEPVVLPMKFPLLLAQGTEGIAVGLSTKILPHNFCEIIKSSISMLKGRKQKIEPDFLTGGIADFSAYKDGKRGGKVKVRAVITSKDAKTLNIKELPYGVTTASLIDSILSANEKKKIQIRRVEDNTAKDVDIQIELPSGASTDQTIEALYAFTDCEVNISVNCCIIRDDKPKFIGVSELLENSVNQTKNLLEAELSIKLGELKEKLHFSSLEKIFIEKRIYRKIENAETWDAVLKTIDKGLSQYKAQFIRDVNEDDLIKLTEIKIKRISKFDSKRADSAISKLKESVAEVEYDLEHLIEYSIRFYENLLKKYGKGRERRTKKATFEEIKAKQVAVANLKVYVNRKEGFVGTNLKKEEFLEECSTFDEIIGLTRSGEFRVVKVAPKTFIGKDLLHTDVFKRGDDRRIYHMIYRDGRQGPVYAKRFSIGGVTRDKVYDLTRGTKGSRVLYLSVNPNGEQEVVSISLKSKTKRAKTLTLDFSELEVKGRGVKGNLVTKEPVASIELKERGGSTFAAQQIWFDPASGKMNSEQKGQYLGEMDGDEFLLVFHQDGTYELIPFEFDHYFGTKVDFLEVYDEQTISVIYKDGEKNTIYVKRFEPDPEVLNKRVEFRSQSRGSKTLVLTTSSSPLVKVTFKKVGQKAPMPELVRVADFIDVKGVKARGNKLSKNDIKDVSLL